MASRDLLPAWFVESFTSTHPEDRIQLATVLQLLDDAVAMSGDPDLGLHAALRAEIDTPLLEYVTASCSTIRESLETFARYVMLVNDAIQVKIVCDETTVRVEFQSSVPMNRAAVDFGIASFHRLRLRWEPADLDRAAEELQPEDLGSTALSMFQASNIASARNGWIGTNLTSYNNPEFERRWSEYTGTLDIAQRKSVSADLLRWLSEEVNFFPLFYTVGSSITAHRKGVRGPTNVTTVQRIGTWNAHEWEMD